MARTEISPEEKVIADKKIADVKADKELKAKAKTEAADKKKSDAVAEKARKEKEKVDKKTAADAEKERKAKEKEANRMPEQNGIRRPKPDTLCGKAWGEADRLSTELGQPVPIKQLLEVTNAIGYNAGNVKAEYARWRKFNGVTGRVSLPKKEEPKKEEKATEK